jgi:hypothetical protein
MENYLSKFIHNTVGRLKSVHQRLLNIETEKLAETTRTNPYQLFLVWLLDVIVYGSIITFILNTYFGWQGWRNIVLIPANGMLIWLTIDYVKQMRNATRGND